jgi:hypothetical protein
MMDQHTDISTRRPELTAREAALLQALMEIEDWVHSAKSGLRGRIREIATDAILEALK